MKRTLRLTFVVFALLCANMAVHAQEKSALFDFNKKGLEMFPGITEVSSDQSASGDITETKSTSVDGVKLTVGASGGNINNRFWKDNRKGTQLRMYGGTLKIELPAGNRIVSVAWDAVAKKYPTTTSDPKASTKNGWTPNAETNEVTFTVNATIKFNSITVKYVAADGKKPAGLSFSDTYVTAELGTDNVFPVLSKETDATVTYTSENAEVAEVDNQGNVTLKKAGTTTIHANAEATGAYQAGTASYKLVVKEKADESRQLTLAEFKALAKGTSALVKLTDAKVTFVALNKDASEQTVYLQDATGAMAFFMAELGCKAGQTINGTLKAVRGEYNGLIQATNVTDKQLQITDGTAAVPSQKELSQVTLDDQSMLVKVTGKVESRKEGKFTNTYVTDGTNSVMIFDKNKVVQGGLGNLSNEKTYVVQGVVIPFKGKPEILVVSIVDEQTAGIDNLQMDAAEGGKIYDLQGREVKVPGRGVYIVNGKKVVF